MPTVTAYFRDMGDSSGTVFLDYLNLNRQAVYIAGLRSGLLLGFKLQYMLLNNQLQSSYSNRKVSCWGHQCAVKFSLTTTITNI